MKPSEVLNYVITGYKARTPTFIWGPPGVGKSDVVRQAREVLDVNLIDQRLSQMDPTDLKGIPFNNKGYTDYAIPNFLPRVERDGPNGILFLDEFLGLEFPAVRVPYRRSKTGLRVERDSIEESDRTPLSIVTDRS